MPLGTPIEAILRPVAVLFSAAVYDCTFRLQASVLLSVQCRCSEPSVVLLQKKRCGTRTEPPQRRLLDIIPRVAQAFAGLCAAEAAESLHLAMIRMPQSPLVSRTSGSIWSDEGRI